ncbi:MAG: insertion element IS1 protein InsB [Bacteroidia bacterium]|jgi:insertion element IS1 protein InsB
MRRIDPKCSKRGDVQILCTSCHGYSVKNGKSRSGIQRFKCTFCCKRFQAEHQYQAYLKDTDKWIKDLMVEGSGIRSISRLLNISPTTVISRILLMSSNITRPHVPLGKIYEMDKMCTYIGNKGNRIWIAYAIRRDTKDIVSFNVGKRSNKTLRTVSDTLILSNAKWVYTDKLRNYLSLIPKAIHRTKQYSINHIERKNLTLRTHLKRLNRRTICFSRSIAMLTSCLKIYFWGQ